MFGEISDICAASYHVYLLVSFQREYWESTGLVRRSRSFQPRETNRLKGRITTMPTKHNRKSKKRVAKEARRNLRLWAEGARENILLPHIEPYADKLERGWREESDYLQIVTNKFHARISWRLADHEEPELPLPSYDPKAVQDEEMLDEEETAEKRKRIDDLNAVSDAE
jgi:hypothetical protein